MSIQNYQGKLLRSELLTEKQLSNLSQTVIAILSQEPNLLELNGEQYVVGDIHGQFYDLLKMFGQVTQSLITRRKVSSFLGIMLIEAITLFRPFAICFAQNAATPLESSCSEAIMRLHPQPEFMASMMKFQRSTEIITLGKRSLSAVINNEILCIHGGLSPSIPFVDNICEIERVKEIPEIGSMCDLVWSDPDSTGDREGWFVNNRGAGYIFTKDIVKQFLYLNNLKTIARAHQLVEQGYIYNFEQDIFVTIWSAPNYCYRCGNQASVMKVSGSGQKIFLKFNESSETSVKKIHYDHILPYFL